MRKKQRELFLEGYEELSEFIKELTLNEIQKPIVKNIEKKFNICKKSIERKKDTKNILEYKTKEHVRNSEIVKLHKICKENNIINDIELIYTESDKTCFSDIEKLLKIYIVHNKLKKEDKTIKIDNFIISLLKGKNKYKEFLEIVGKDCEKFKHQRILTLCKFLI